MTQKKIHTMGLKDVDWKDFQDMLKKSNTEQLRSMLKLIKAELLWGMNTNELKKV